MSLFLEQQKFLENLLSQKSVQRFEYFRSLVYFIRSLKIGTTSMINLVNQIFIFIWLPISQLEKMSASGEKAVILWKVQSFPPEDFVNTYAKLRLSSARISTRQNRAEESQNGVGSSFCSQGEVLCCLSPKRNPPTEFRLKVDSTDPSELTTLRLEWVLGRSL